ncbi:hypothetical protein IT407_04775 [Candidatus Uhrbacteria bacterium]|nr:hypothetical protein [Candidatus Uhrbacteria bacterium]
MMRAGTLFLLFLSLNACAPLVGTECTTGVRRPCAATAGRTGTQICASGIWQACVEAPVTDSGPVSTDSGGLSGTDSGSSVSADAGSFYVWPDAGSSVMSDAGTSLADSGCMVPASCPDPTPEAAQRRLCEDLRHPAETGRLVIRYDNACLDRVFDHCASGWSLVGWDSSIPSCGSPSDPGSGVLVLDRLHRRGGYYQLSLICISGATPPGWPATLHNTALNAGCLTSARFEDGIELADNEARFCPGYAHEGRLLATVPAQPGAIANCP